MTNPLDVLPFIDGDTYTFKNQELSGGIINPGNKKIVNVSGVDRGYYFGTVTVIQGEGGERVELSIKVDGFTADTTPRQLYNSGFVSPQGITPGLSKYDTDNNIFTAIHNPQRTIPFNDIVKFTQRAPADSDGVFADTSVFSIGITNEEKFVRQYLQITNPELLGTREIDNLVDQILL